MRDDHCTMSQLPTSVLKEIDRLCDQFELGFRSDTPDRIEDYLRPLPEAYRAFALRELLVLELTLKVNSEVAYDVALYQQRFPEYASVVAAVIEQFANERAGDPTRVVAGEDGLQRTDSQMAEGSDQSVPQRIGRYEIRNVLGEGAFGHVYLAYDPELDRLVALKVPRQRMFEQGLGVARFVEEARNAARLKHPAIIGVYDVQEHNAKPYIVQEYVEGKNLAEWTKSQKPAWDAMARVFIPLAEAVGFAHQQGLIHRDLKPQNVLIDQNGGVHVADFGLAVHESQQFERQGEVAGTPAYMSPEQTRGEMHRLDGRTDIWSLGVMLYELLVGTRPFAAATRQELFANIQTMDPLPPSQRALDIPPELSRICLKCLKKRRSDRYSCTSDLVDDLRCWLADVEKSRGPIDNASRRDSETQAELRIVPKGLRSFDEHDADFFLGLLPGPRDRQGLPDSIRFWKTSIEQTDPDSTFSVGLIYGPSGCGKSSLVKAGLIPRLERHVLPVYIEATPHDTEQRLLKGLAKRCPELATGESLPDVVREIRQRMGPGRKVLIVLDQFEQWLHAHRNETNAQLVNGLRQCDGGQVQCLLTVRDDFWMGITHFMRQLEIPIVEGRNSAAVDLFDLGHATKVLAAFGRAFERLPKQPTALSGEQADFLNRAVRELSQGDKVVCVHLALLAHMFKGKPWTTAELKRVGGAQGLGEAFLEESFSAATAPPQHRYHQESARAILMALLPEAGSSTQSTMRSRQELLEASQTTHRPGDFESLVQILDTELHLITPTDSEASIPAQPTTPAAQRDQVYYHLTHDYLVPSLRNWLTHKQVETRGGRAELRLTELTDIWRLRPQNRFLPSWWEYLSILSLTRWKSWTDPQRRMMRAARRLYVTGLALAVVLAMLVYGFACQINGRLHAHALTSGLLEAQPDAVLRFSHQLKPYLRWGRPRLEQLASSEPTSPADRQSQLHAQLALVETDGAFVQALKEALLTEQPAYLGSIREALRPYESSLVDDLWNQLHDASALANRRFRAGLALATYAPGSNRWTAEDFSFLADQLIAANPDHQPQLRNYLRPVRQRLLGVLERLCLDPQLAESQLMGAANALVDFASGDVARLVSVLGQASPAQFPIVFRPIREALDPDESQLVPDLWTQLHDTSAPTERRFRAGLALAAYPTVSNQWTSDDFAFLASQLIAANPDHQPRLREYLRPVREQLLPILEGLCLDNRLPERQLLGATNALADLARDDASRLARVLSMSTPVQYEILFPVLNELRDTAASHLLRQLAAEGPADDLLPLDRVALGKRRAGAAITLLRQGARNGVRDVLRVSDDPESLTQFVHGCRARQITAPQLLECVRLAAASRQKIAGAARAIEDRMMFGLLLAMGEYSPEELKPEDRESFVADLADWYASDPSSAIHGSAGWLLRNWGFENIARKVDETPLAYAPDREWFTMKIVAEPRHESSREPSEPATNGESMSPAITADNSEPRTIYLTFVVFPAGQYEIGSPDNEPGRRSTERRHPVTITRPFAVLDRELTFNEMVAFDESFAGLRQDLDCGPLHAAAGVNWYAAVRFCRWLTKQAGWSEADQPYPAAESLDKLEFPADAEPRADGAPKNWPLLLDRRGFRLPTVAEWEIACRAGTRTTYGFGCDATLLSHYAWFAQNSGQTIHAVRTRRPSLAGLFDMHGNVLEWCHDWYGEYRVDGAIDPIEPAAYLLNNYRNQRMEMRRVNRGGTWGFSARFCRSAYRNRDIPVNQFNRVGFRVAFCPSLERRQR